jgi:uncharacterized membrane protein
MKRLTGLSLVLAGLLYPFAVYFGRGVITPRHLALLLGAIWLLRCVYAQPSQRPVALAALGFCALLAVAGTPQMLRWYPALINGVMLAVFASSLRYGRPVVERLARLQEPDLPPGGVAYTRKVTQVWVLFFLLNGLIAVGLTLWAPLSWWTLYNGFIAYMLMGLLFVGEWLVRGRVRSAM